MENKETPWPSDLTHLQWLEYLEVTKTENLRVLDVGCGSGYLCSHVKNLGAKRVVGIDIVEPQAIADRDWIYKNINLSDATWADVVMSEVGNEPFDLIFAFDIIEHLVSPYTFLLNCRKLLKHTGTFVLTTPNSLSWERFVNPSNWSGVRDVQHKYLFTIYSLNFLMNKGGFSITSISAPVRILKFLGALSPQIGGQILLRAQPQ